MSSTMPLQLSSIPLHVSVTGLTEPRHSGPFSPHTKVPALHAPRPQRPLGQHAVPTPVTSSTSVLQSLSSPSHTSPLGLTAPMHSMPVVPQRSVPDLQTPVPHLPLGQQLPPTVPPGKSSTTPLQS